MITRRFSLLILALLWSTESWAAPLRVLISADAKNFATELAATLTARGATARVAALEQAALSESDVLVLDAQETRALSAPLQSALEHFAQRGGGIVALHGAIGSGDAAWSKALLGGGWTPQSRKFSNRMMFYTAAETHPIIAGASPFDLDDETLYDLETDPAIHVLASAFTPKVTAKKIDPRSPEKLDRANIYDLQPQMWAFEGADKHRAVVLLQGQPATLLHPSIQTLILRSIAWAGSRANIDELTAPEAIASLRYPKDGPRTAAETIKQFELAPEFKVSVVASEPLINKPIAMQWDARGRLWIAETPEYPNGRRPMVTEPWKETGVLAPGSYDRQARDRISILESTHGDGVMDKKTVFYEGLELVTGFCLFGDGAIVVGQPDIVFLHDSDGDGKAERVERLYTGFSPGDTHFVANHFIAGPDGWIYANTGSGPKAEGVINPALKVQLSAGVFRFRPDGSAIEQIASKGGNGFGLDLTSDGEIFFGQATSGSPVQHVILPEALLAKGKVGNTAGVESAIRSRKVIRPDMPTRAALMQIDVVGGFSSACASTVAEAGAWPAPWDRMVFCTEPILDIVHTEKLVSEGPTFRGEMVREDAEWLRSKDYWFFPVDVQFGPDGAMYLLDFYCPVVAHSDTRGPQHSKAGASIRPDRDHYFGRIYRIQHDQARQLSQPDLTKLDAAGLAALFTHPNKWTRATAQRVLLARPDAQAALPLLARMADSEKFAPARTLALWSLQRLGKLPPATLQTALVSDDPLIRKGALLVAEANCAAGLDLAALVNDPDPRVRLTAFRTLASSELSPKAARALLAVLPKLEDAWSKSAAVAAAASNPTPLLEAALASNEAPSQALIELATSLAAILADKQEAPHLARLVVAAGNAAPAAAPLIRAILTSAARNLSATLSPDATIEGALKKLLGSNDLTLSGTALPFAAHWSVGGSLKPLITSQIESLLALVADSGQPDAARAGAALALVRVKSADARIIPALLALLPSKMSDSLVLDLIAALTSSTDPSLGEPLAVLLPSLSTLGQSALFDALITRAEWANAILDGFEKGTLKPALLGPPKLSKLRLHPDRPTAERALKLINALGGGTSAQKAELIAKLLPQIESRTGDPAKGKVVFLSACSVCHKLNGEGKEVGPVLDGIGVHGPQELLIHILDPSRVVDNEHRTWSVALKNRAFATGIVARENDRSLTLRLPGGAEQEVKLQDIKSRQDTGLSLMPEGFEALGSETLGDLLAYLGASASQFRALNLGQAFTADTRGGLYHSRESRNDSLQPVKYGVNTVEGIPFSLPDPTTTPTGNNIIVLKNGDGREFASTFAQRVEIPVGFAASALHFLGGVAGWGGGPDLHKPAMRLTIEFSDGQRQVEELGTGETFIDYVSNQDVPKSKRVEGIVVHHHVRLFSIPVTQRISIRKLILESYKNGIAPTTLAITASLTR